MSARTNSEAVQERFPKDTEGFILTVLHEEGHYRHLRFQRPGQRWGSTDIHTWPGGVVTSGDMADGWMFERGLGFFAGPPNLHYWHEKLARSGRKVAKEFSASAARSELVSAAADLDVPDSAREALATEVEDLIEEITGAYAETNAALERVSGFTFECEDEDGVDVDVTFSDPYEMDVEDYTYHFVWACHVLSTAARWLASEDERVVRDGDANA